jgi:hypothetical protein
MSLALAVNSSQASAQSADPDPGRALSEQAPAVKPLEGPPLSPAAETSVSSQPEGQKTAAVPRSSSTNPESSTWPLPAILVMSAIGVEVVGAAFVVGSHIAAMNSLSDLEGSIPNATTRGCREALGPCGRIEDAFKSVNTAQTVGGVGLLVATGVAASLFFGGALAWKLSPDAAAEPEVGLSVQVVPGPGGMVIQGTF